MTALAHYDFHDLPIGSISGWPYGPEGEYHVMPEQPCSGAWEEANITYAWRAGTGCWKVIPEEGRHVMEQTLLIDTDTPLLVAGSRLWDDYTVTADIRPLGWARPIGLVARYVNSRCYCFLGLFRDHVALVLREHERETVLVSERWHSSVDSYCRVSVRCDGGLLTGVVDGEALVSAQQDALRRGRIGLLAESPARFADVMVTTDERSASAIRAAEVVRENEEGALRAANPKPVLWKRFSTLGWGTDRNLRFGDLDGDGELEIVVPQAIHHGRGDAFPMIICLTAVDLDGNVLWRLGEPIETKPHMTGDLCVQCYDWDGDGQAEVVYTQDFELRVLEGSTGRVKQAIPTPSYGDEGSALPYARAAGDCIYFCDLEGRGERRNLILKDRYKTIWAFDNDLDLLWSRELNTGHYPIACDVDDDGREELLVGYSLLDHDGSTLWELDLSDHLDGAYLGRLAGPDSPVRIAMGCSDEGFVLADIKGRIIAHQRRGHCQGATVARLLPGRDDLQIATITYWHHPGIITIYDTDGAVLSECEPLQMGSILPPVDWAGKGTALLLHNTHPKLGGLMDASGRRAVIFPDDGHPHVCCDAIDLSGDGHQEIITWDWDEIWVYRADPRGLPPARPYHSTPIYNNSNYRARWLI